MITVHRNQRKLCDQLQRLTKYVGNRNIIRTAVVGIQCQDTLHQTVHQILTRCLHYNVTDKRTGKLLQTCYDLLEHLKLRLIRKTSKQQQIGCLLKRKSLLWIRAY